MAKNKVIKLAETTEQADIKKSSLHDEKYACGESCEPF